MRRFKAVTFDLDDTLFPERQFVLSGFKTVADYIKRIYNLELHQEFVEAYANGERTNVLFRVLNRHFSKVEPLLLQRLSDIYRCHFPALELYPDARVALALLSRRGIRTGLMTDGYGCVQKNKVDALNARSLIDSMVFADDLGGPQYWKPCKDPFFILAIQLEVEPTEMVYVGDNATVDFLAPRQLGMGAIQVARRGDEYAGVPPPSPHHAPHVRIASLEMLPEALEELEQSMPTLSVDANCPRPASGDTHEGYAPDGAAGQGTE